MKNIKHKPATEYSKITPYVYVGTNACCQTHFKKELLDKGIKADISLEDDRIDAAQGIDFFLWLPTKDHTAPKPKQLRLGVEYIDFCVKNKIKVYIHCRNGHTRAPTMAVAYFITQGMTVTKAIDFVKSKRPDIHLSLVQIKALKRFYKTTIKI